MLSVKIRKKFGKQTNTPGGVSESIEGFMLDVEFEALPGVTVLFGASGSGKSLTLKSVAGIVRPDEGHITVAEHVLFDSERGVDLPIRSRRVGYVFQNLALFPHLSALANVEMALPKQSRRERALAMLESFGIKEVAPRSPREISGGEAQRVALARALAGEPQMLLLDEPLSALDEVTKRDIISDLKTLNRRLRLPIIYVTHSRDEAVALGERVIVYERGRIVASGEPLEVFHTPTSAGVARLTGVENIFEGRVVHSSTEAGTMTVEIADEADSCRVEVPLGSHIEGERVRLAVRAGDILLATVEPRFTSARNILRGRVVSIEETGAGVRVSVLSGVRWSAGVTRQSARELQLKKEQEVWLAFKTYSCHLLDT